MRFNSYYFLWLCIALFPLIVIVILLPIQPHDYWWYLRLGKDVIETNTVPVIDTYSSVQYGKSIVYQSWLSAVGLWMIYKTGAVSSTIFFVAFLIACTYSILFILMIQNGIGPRLATILLLLVGLSGSNNWGVRPQLFAYPLFMIAIWLLHQWQKQKDKYLWFMIPLGLLWANLHGSFILLFILLVLAILFGNGNKRKIFTISFFTFCATFINPRDYVLWQNVIETFTTPGIRDLSPEWLPPLNQGWQMNIYFAWLILLVPLATISSQKISKLDWSFFVVFTWLALSGIRYVIWDLFIIAILTAKLLPKNIVEKFDEVPKSIKPTINILIGLMMLTLPLTLLPSIREIWWQDAPPPLDISTPVSASEWLLTHPELPDKMWNDVVFGSYLIHAMPSRLVSIDTRIQVIYTAEQAQRYLYIQSVQPAWEEYLKQDGINLLFLAQTQTALVNAVKISNEWCLQYEDETSTIFSRCELTP